jgi:hypothetical protein
MNFGICTIVTYVRHAIPSMIPSVPMCSDRSPIPAQHRWYGPPGPQWPVLWGHQGTSVKCDPSFDSYSTLRESNIGNGESLINGQLQWQNHVRIYVTCKSCWPHARRTATTSASTDQLQLPLAMASEGSKDQAMCRAKCDLRSAGFSWAHHLGQSLVIQLFSQT